jgi:hypothetical protein
VWFVQILKIEKNMLQSVIDKMLIKFRQTILKNSEILFSKKKYMLEDKEKSKRFDIYKI